MRWQGAMAWVHGSKSCCLGSGNVFGGQAAWQEWRAVAQSTPPTCMRASGDQAFVGPLQEGGIRVRRHFVEDACQLHLLLHTGQLEALTVPATVMHRCGRLAGWADAAACSGRLVLRGRCRVALPARLLRYLMAA